MITFDNIHADQIIQLFGGGGLHRLRQMRVGLQRQRYRRMAEPLADHLGMPAGFQHQAGCGMPEIVKADFRHTRAFTDPPECLIDDTLRARRPHA